MKKAKIALSAIALLGVTGSIFAFKAAKRGATIPYYIQSASGVAANATWTKGVTHPGGTGVFYFFTTSKGNIPSRSGTVSKAD